MKQLILDVVKAMVESPEQVEVREIKGETLTLLELKVANSDLGKVIGRQGRIAQSLRVIVSAVAGKLQRHYILEIVQ